MTDNTNDTTDANDCAGVFPDDEPDTCALCGRPRAEHAEGDDD